MTAGETTTGAEFLQPRQRSPLAGSLRCAELPERGALAGLAVSCRGALQSWQTFGDSYFPIR